MTDYFETHYNMAHGSMVADLYAEDATYTTASGEFSKTGGHRNVLPERHRRASAQIEIDQIEQAVFGDLAVARGTYSITGESEGNPVSYGGAYLTHPDRTTDGWQVQEP